MEQIKFRAALTEAIKFWEPARLIYNFGLSAIVLFYIEKAELWSVLASSEFIANCVILAILANIAYTMAYFPDLALRYSLLDKSTKRKGSIIIFCLGMIVACLLCRFIADELVRSYAWMAS